jgi:hypothetical protein
MCTRLERCIQSAEGLEDVDSLGLVISIIDILVLRAAVRLF